MDAHIDPGFDARKQKTLEIAKEYQDLAEHSTTELNSVLEKKVKDVLRYTYRNLGWWREKLGKKFLSEVESLSLEALLQKIPLLTKAEQRSYSVWLKIWVKGSRSADYVESSTSGSTGQPVQVTKYLPDYHFRHLAIRLIDALWQSRDLSKSFLSLTQSKIDGDFPDHGEPYTFVAATGPMRVANVSRLKPEEILQLISGSGASNVSMNGVLLRILIDEQLKNPLHKIYIDEILTFADPIDQELRELAREVFGARISDRYSCEELGFLAIQCRDFDHLHALQFHNYIEILNSQGQPCAIGEIGRVVVTGLTNPGMPLIRYEIGDLARWAKPCPSGNPLPVLDPVITRTRDVLIDGNGVSFVPTTGKAGFLRFKEIEDFQLYLFDNALAVLISVRSELSDFQLEQIVSDVQRMFRTLLPVHVFTTDSLAWLGTWKRRVFYRIDGPIPLKPGPEDFRAFSPVIEPR